MTTKQFHYTAGRLVAGQLKREILRAAVDTKEITVSFEESAGLLEKLVIVTVSGREPVVDAFIRAVSKWIEETQ